MAPWQRLGAEHQGWICMTWLFPRAKQIRYKCWSLVPNIFDQHCPWSTKSTIQESKSFCPGSRCLGGATSQTACLMDVVAGPGQDLPTYEVKSKRNMSSRQVGPLLVNSAWKCVLVESGSFPVVLWSICCFYTPSWIHLGKAKWAPWGEKYPRISFSNSQETEKWPHQKDKKMGNHTVVQLPCQIFRQQAPSFKCWFPVNFFDIAELFSQVTATHHQHRSLDTYPMAIHVPFVNKWSGQPNDTDTPQNLSIVPNIFFEKGEGPELSEPPWAPNLRNSIHYPFHPGHLKALGKRHCPGHQVPA